MEFLYNRGEAIRGFSDSMGGYDMARPLRKQDAEGRLLCSKCKIYRWPNEFWKGPLSDGYQARCKYCMTTQRPKTRKEIELEAELDAARERAREEYHYWALLEIYRTYGAARLMPRPPWELTGADIDG
jgi:hypothetical protein